MTIVHAITYRMLGACLRATRVLETWLHRRWVRAHRAICEAGAFPAGTIVRVICTVGPRCSAPEDHRGVWLVEGWYYDSSDECVRYALARSDAPYYAPAGADALVRWYDLRKNVEQQYVVRARLPLT